MRTNWHSAHRFRLPLTPAAARGRAKSRRALLESLEPRTLLTGDSLAALGPISRALNTTPPSASVTLLTTDLAGNPISSIGPGQDFKLEALVQDLRTKTDKTGFGVYAEYVNVTYDSTLVTIPGTLEFGPDFPNRQNPAPPTLAVTTPGKIVQAGGFGESDAISATALPPAQLLWTATVHAVAGGMVTFHPSQPLSPNAAFDVYGDDASIPSSQISYVDASITITPPVAVSIDSVSQNEGNTGTTNFVFTVSLAQTAVDDVTVVYATADGTATVAGGDYAATSGTLTFAAGTTSLTVTVAVAGDVAIEPDEQFTVNLTSASDNATIAIAQGVGTIINDDFPTVSINNVSQAEGNSGTTNFVFTVSLSAPAVSNTTVEYGTADDSASVADGDYTATSGTLTFTPGASSLTITVAVTGDTTIEADETFNVNLSNANKATIATAQGVGTIVNDDFPTVSINSVSQAEGNSGITNFVFTVSLSAPAVTNATVAYATSDDTATVAGGDYTATSGTLTFTAGTSSLSLTVAVAGDTTIEPDETFNVNLTSASQATIATAQGVGTIVNDDVPLVSINSVSRLEGDSGTTSFVFTVSLSAPAVGNATVRYATADGTATVAGGDYTAASGTLTFTVGISSLTVTVSVAGDTAVESNETFSVVLSNPSGAALGTSTGTGTIGNDDGLAAPYQNPLLRYDVNADGNVFPLDALIIINQLNSSGASVLPVPPPPGPRMYVDVDGNGTLAPLDALLVINYLNATGLHVGSSFNLSSAAGNLAQKPALVATGASATSGLAAATAGVPSHAVGAAIQEAARPERPLAGYEHDLESTLDDLLGPA